CAAERDRPGPLRHGVGRRGGGGRRGVREGGGDLPRARIGPRARGGAPSRRSPARLAPSRRPVGARGPRSPRGARMSAPAPSIVAYLMAGYPSPAQFAVLLPRVAAVCDAVEIGIPFSDPVADGISIQRASRAALAQGTTVRDLFELLLRSREAIS